MHFFKISYLKLSVLVFLVLMVGLIAKDTWLACAVSALFMGAAFLIDAMYWLERRSHDKAGAGSFKDQAD